MFLSSSQRSALGSIVTHLSEAPDGDTLREMLGPPLLALISADHCASMVWDEDQRRFGRFAAVNLSADALRHWDRYYRFIDPLTFPMMARRRPTLVTQIMSQQALQKTEFFADFLQPERMHWGLNVYFFHGERCIGDFRIFRRRERGDFGPEALDLLRLLEPGITSALHRLDWAASKAPKEAASHCAEEVLQRSLGLTQREAQVAWLVSCGCPDKQIATRLQIGLPTVRFHLSRAFDKARAKNRVALAALVQSTLEVYRQSEAPAALRCPPVSR